jgi:hypothetical protein
MKTALILIISGILIGAGISIIWLDGRKRRRGAFVSQREARPDADPEIEITISHAAAADTRPRAAARTDYPPPPGSWAVAGAVAGAIAGAPADATAGDAAGGPEPEPPTLEEQWAALQPAIAAGVDNTNAALASAHLFINTSGDPSWSYKNKGYGAYRRLLLGGESLGWLRLELSAEGRLRASVKAHKDDRALVNTTAEVPAEGLTAARVSDLFSRCLKPALAFAAHQRNDSEEEASREAWESVDPVVSSALKATNGALAQAGAQLIALAPPAWEQELRRHRMTLCVEVNGDDVARMHIERLAHEMEVAVGVRDPHLIDLGRRRRIPVEGMTIHSLAELIASCAWPAIARFRESRRQA